MILGLAIVATTLAACNSAGNKSSKNFTKCAVILL